jgi:hypothetical protein
MNNDKDYRKLNYVEVIYLKEGFFKNRKFVHYPEKEAEQMYLRTVNKMTEDKVESLVTLRTEEHTLLKSHRVTPLT